MASNSLYCEARVLTPPGMAQGSSRPAGRVLTFAWSEAPQSMLLAVGRLAFPPTIVPTVKNSQHHPFHKCQLVFFLGRIWIFCKDPIIHRFGLRLSMLIEFESGIFML